MLLALAALAAASCGGPYTPKRMNLATDKLALADRLFDKGSFGSAAVEYKDFLATFAGDERSDYAQYRLAESYRFDEEYALAEVEYRILINDYGYSDWVDDAFYLEGVCAFRQTPRFERDQTKSYQALERLNRFLQMFPSSWGDPAGAIEEYRSVLQSKDAIPEKAEAGKRLKFLERKAGGTRNADGG
ncbi:MAG: outer membrane protein assembly factor BamD [Candidatus Krumholzibacteria bacterium]|nr:outer membrane protein assembly factor BamD [Candidatus Krumholzibacteria bacterium]